MRNFKKAAAIGLAATMLMGSTVTAFAAEGGATGNGTYEGYVEEISVFSVEVPTDASATKGFDFFVDPNGLLAATDYASKEGTTAADFETNATLFFTRTPVAADESKGVQAVTKFGKDSEAIIFKNKSSYAVNVEVAAAVTGADGITLGAVEDDTTAPTIYLALVTPGTDGNTTTAITSSGAKVTGTIDGENSNFEVVYKAADEAAGTAAGYYYEQKKPTDEAPLAPWKTYSFSLTGACGGTWTAEQAEVAPTVTLTWKVTDPEAGPSLSNATASSDTGVDFDVTFTKGTALTCAFSGLGDGVTLKLVTWGASATDMTGTTTNIPLNGTSFTINSNMWGSASAGDAKYIKLTTSDNKVIVVKAIVA